MLDLIDETYLVTTHDIPSLHQAKQMIQFLLDGGYPRSNLRLVLNRVPKRLDVTLEELEKMLGINIYATILNDYPAMQEAYAEGRMVEAASALGKSFSRLTAKITGTEPKKKTGFSFFS